MKNYKMAWRNLWRNRRRTLITAASIFFAVFFALLMTSLQTGSYDYLYKNAIESYSGYIQLQQENWWDEKTIDNTFDYSEEISDLLMTDENVRATIPRLESFALASSGSTTKGVMVLGVDPEKEVHLSDLNHNRVSYLISPMLLEKVSNSDLFSEKNKQNAELFLGYAYSNIERLMLDLGIEPKESESFIPFLNKYATYRNESIKIGEPGVWIGYKLAQFLELDAGDTIVLMGQGYHGATAAGKFEIKGLMRLPMPEMNSNVVYMPFDIAQDFYKCENKITSLIVNLLENDDKAVLQTGERLGKVAPEGTKIVDWKEMNEILIAQMEADDVSGKAMLFILYLVIFFGVVGTVLMMTAERKREFGVLVAIGMQKKKLASVMSYEMLYIGLLGIAAASIVCIPIISYGVKNPFIFTGEIAYMMADYGFEAQLVFEPIGVYFLWQAIIVGIMVGISLIYPVRKILGLQVVTALRA
jgi:ABC-type lipoprotein release transport system permease subunit